MSEEAGLSKNKTSNKKEHQLRQKCTWIPGIVIATIFLFIGYWFSQYQEAKSPKRLGETGVVDNFVIRVSDFKCNEGSRADSSSTNQEANKKLDRQICTGSMTALNTTNKSDNLYTDVILYVGDDQYTESENNLPLGTEGIFPHQRGEAKLYFEIPIGAVPTMLRIKPSTEGPVDTLNPFDINDIRYDLR